MPRSLRWYSALPPGEKACDRSFSPLTSRTLLAARPPERAWTSLSGSAPLLEARTRLGDRLGDEGYDYLVAGLNRLAGPSPSDVHDRPAHDFKEGQRPSEVLLVSPDHDRERALYGPDVATGYEGVEHT